MVCVGGSQGELLCVSAEFIPGRRRADGPRWQGGRQLANCQIAPPMPLLAPVTMLRGVSGVSLFALIPTLDAISVSWRGRAFRAGRAEILHVSAG